MPMSPRLLRPIASRSLTDADATAYLTAVQAADGQALEPLVRDAITAFVIGCKADGVWSAIKASCLLIGARTLSGALTPLVGSAPTNNNFVSGDYNRTTGLLGNGSNKSLNTNYAENADPLDSHHCAAYVSTVGTQAVLGVGTNTSISAAATRSRANSAALFTIASGFIGISRSASDSYVRRNNNANTTIASTSGSTSSTNYSVFDTGISFFGSHRIAFYSLGPSLSLSALDSRITTLYNAIGAAIP